MGSVGELVGRDRQLVRARIPAHIPVRITRSVYEVVFGSGEAKENIEVF